MGRYTRGKRAVLMDDIFGRKIKYKDARTQWDGMRVFKGDYTEKQPQLDPQKYLKLGGTDVLKEPRPDNDASNQTVTIELGPLYGNWSGQIAVQPPPVPPRLVLNFLNTPITGLSATAGFTLTPNQLSFKAQPSGIQMQSFEGSTGIFFNKTEVPPSQLATSSQGTISFNLKDQPDGIQLTANQGTLILNGVENVVGQSATTQQGTTNLGAVAHPIGTQLTAEQGTTVIPLTEVPPGQEATTAQGTTTLALAEEAIGIEATSQQGTIGFFIAQQAFPSGIQATSQQGDAAFAVVAQVTGLPLTASEGTANAILNFTENAVGMGLQAFEGGTGFSFNKVEVPPGIQAASQQGTVILNAQVNVSGLSSTAQRGTITAAFPGYGLNPWGQG